MVKNPPTNAGDTGDAGLTPGSGRSPGGGNGNPLQYSCLKNLMDRGSWKATTYRSSKSQTQLSDWTQTHTIQPSTTSNWLDLRISLGVITGLVGGPGWELRGRPQEDLMHAPWLLRNSEPSKDAQDGKRSKDVLCAWMTLRKGNKMPWVTNWSHTGIPKLSLLTMV